MKALGYTQAHTLDAFNLQLTELPDPIPTGRDLLVEVKAIGLNPIDYKIRSRRSGTDGQPVILGWDAAGIVRASGNEWRKQGAMERLERPTPIPSFPLRGKESW